MGVWWLCWIAAWAGPGFSGVGGPSEAPGFEASEGDEPKLADVLRHEDELLRMVSRVDPKLHGQLLTLRETDRTAYVGALMKVARNVHRARRDPVFRERMQAMRRKTRELQEAARGFEDLSKANQRARRAELERLAGELMDLKQADRRARLEDMQTRLTTLQQEIDRREREREQIIEDFVDQLLRERVNL